MIFMDLIIEVIHRLKRQNFDYALYFALNKPFYDQNLPILKIFIYQEI